MKTLLAIGLRIFYAAILILAVIVLNFILLHLAPGDPADVIAGEMGGATEEILEEIRKAYGLDQPWYVQLGIYLSKIATGDFGQSYFYNNTPVADLVFGRLGATLLLVVTALVFAIAVGTFLGVMAARKPNGIVSGLITVLALVGYSAPVFWTGLMLIIVFAWAIPIFPIANMYDVALQGGTLTRILDVAHHLVLPAFTLGVIYIAIYSRLARASMLEVLGSDYIRTARAKGLSERVVVGKHALRNAILPVVTLAGLQFGQIISGAVLVETVFNWPGLGTLALEAILGRDYPTILGILFLSATIVIIANLLTDLAYRIIDPRIRGKA